MSRKLRSYIEEQPQLPTGFRYKTPIDVSVFFDGFLDSLLDEIN
jgi:hypothetical protein